MTLRFHLITRCIAVLLLFAACNRKEQAVQRSFYYWRTVFQLSPTEAETVRQLGINHLYLRFFDVHWNEALRSAEPVAKTVFQQRPGPELQITPVVFLTQEPLQKLDTPGLAGLAKNLSLLLERISANNGLQLSQEVQLDCDWTVATRTAYFFLLEQLRQQPFFRGKTLSATIRLHQLKFLSQAGVPPADKGLLMCYNMGNLRHPQTTNSILDVNELKKYTAGAGNYPLPLDVALPIFDWWLLFEGERYKGLLREFDPGPGAPPRLFFSNDTTINGYAFQKGQWLRHEVSEAAAVNAAASHLSRQLKASGRTVILYHLDSRHLAKYNLHELESFYNRFR